jgi:hypothetical protein
VTHTYLGRVTVTEDEAILIRGASHYDDSVKATEDGSSFARPRSASAVLIVTDPPVPERSLPEGSPATTPVTDFPEVGQRLSSVDYASMNPYPTLDGTVTQLCSTPNASISVVSAPVAPNTCSDIGKRTLSLEVYDDSTVYPRGVQDGPEPLGTAHDLGRSLDTSPPSTQRFPRTISGQYGVDWDWHPRPQQLP